MSLARKTSSGLLWVSLSNIILKIINFIITVILARLLEPEHFGLIAIALVVVNFFETFRQLGLGAALIHKKDDADKAANTAFFLFPAAALVFYVISYLIASQAADFFNEPQIEAMIKALSLIFVIWSFGTLPSTLLDKNLEFKKKMVPQILPKIGYGIASIWLALNGFGVWSLVYGRLILEVLSVLAIWPAINWRPSFTFDWNIARELISYGKQVMMANMLVFLISIVDVTFIGRLLGASELGFYSIALGAAGLLTSQVSMMIGQVMFPVYAMINERNTLKKAFKTTLKYVSLVSIPATFGIFAVAWDFINVFYGDKWLPAVAALQLLCFYGLSRSLFSITESLYLAVGRPDIRVRLNLVQFVLMSLLLYPLTIRYGIFGSSIAVLLPSILILVLTFRETGKILDENLLEISRLFIPGLSGSLIMVVVIYLWNYVTPTFPPILRLSVSIILGSSVYIAYIWSTRKYLFYEVKEMILRK